MKTSVIALSLLSAVAFALPEAHGGWGGHGGWDGKGKGKEHGWGKGDWKDKGKGSVRTITNQRQNETILTSGCQDYWKFTSTYSVVATPDQVVNGTTPTGGQPVSPHNHNIPSSAQKTHTPSFTGRHRLLRLRHQLREKLHLLQHPPQELR